MPSPKEARRQKQLLAQQRKESQASRQIEKRRERARVRQDNLADGFLELMQRWMGHDPSLGPLSETCPDCGAVIEVTYTDDRAHPVHAEPRCRGYLALQAMLGPKSPTLTAWKSRSMSPSDFG